MNRSGKTWKVALLFLIGLPILLAILRSSKSKLANSPAPSLPTPRRPEPLLPSVQTIPTPAAAEPIEVVPEPELAELGDILPGKEPPVPVEPLVPASEPITEQTKPSTRSSSRAGKKWSVLLLFLIGVPTLIYIAWYLNPKEADAPKPAKLPPVETQLAPAASPESSVSPTVFPSPAATPELSPSAPGADLEAPGVPAGRPATAPLAARTASNSPSKSTPVQINTPDSTPEEDLQTVYNLLASYQRVFKSLPVAPENAQVVNAIAGNNPNRVAFIDRTNPAINANGEIVDRWGTPLYFHFLSSTAVEIRSAGPGKQMWASDNIVFGTPNEAGIQR